MIDDRNAVGRIRRAAERGPEVVERDRRRPRAPGCTAGELEAAKATFRGSVKAVIGRTTLAEAVDLTEATLERTRR